MRTVYVGAVFAIAASLIVPTPVYASAVGDGSEPVESISKIAPEVFDEFEAITKIGSETFRSESQNSSTSFDLQEDASFSIKSDTGRSANVTIPEIGPNGSVDFDSGIVSVDHGNGSTTVPVPKEDGSVQVTTVIKDSSAPTQYSYDIAFASATQAEIMGDGSIVYTDAANQFVGGVNPPWAKDKDGHEVPTRYELNGLNLVQVVDHQDLGEDAYPVVADPWLGIDLFKSVRQGIEKKVITINATKSAWGQANHLPTTAKIKLFKEAGWKEVRVKAGRNAKGVYHADSRKSIKQQYDCHVAGGYANIAGAWNLEGWRPTRTKSWIYQVQYHHCNWKTANNR